MNLLLLTRPLVVLFSFVLLLWPIPVRALAFQEQTASPQSAGQMYAALTLQPQHEPADRLNLDSLKVLFRRVAIYQWGDSRAALTELDDFVRGVHSQPEARRTLESEFLEFMNSNASSAGKQFIATRLALVGGDASVAPIMKMLADTTTADLALYVLESIKSPQVGPALQEMLPRAKGRTLVGAINLLGNLRVEAAAGNVAAFISHPDTIVAEAAISALGKIATATTIDILLRAKDNSKGVRRSDICSALLNCADQLRSKGDNAQAIAIYNLLASPQVPLPTRSAALRGAVLADPANASSMISATLKMRDTALHPMAVQLMTQVSDMQDVRAIAGLLPTLPPPSQVMLVTTLAHYRDSGIQSIVSAACKSTNPEVRLASLRSLGRMGDASVVTQVARAAATSRGIEQKEARNSLYVLHAQGIDDTLVALLPRADTPTKIELIKSAGERRTASAVPFLLQAAKDPSERVRLEAAKALKTAADVPHLDPLITLLVRARDDAYRRELEIAVATVARKIPDQSRQDEAVRASHASATDPNVKASLITVLGTIGAPTSLGVLRTALEDKNQQIRRAAIQALSAWPTAEPYSDLWKLAKGGAKNATERTLALRGAVRLIGLNTTLSPDGTVELYRAALDVAPNVDECKLLFSAVGELTSIAAIRLAAGYVGDKNLGQEAEAAVINIAERMNRATRREAVPDLQHLIAKSNNKSNVARAKAMVKALEE